MNAYVSSLSPRVALTTTASDFVTLAKPRITVMVLLTTLSGLFMAPAPVAGATVAWALLGTALVVAGANALNMYIERDVDRHMARTRGRPLPMGRMAPWMALVFGVTVSLVSLPILWFGTNPVTAGLAALANVSYVLLYTPLKQRSWWAVVVGAVPGAMPPLLGWTAATGRIDFNGLALFAILFFWQIPHFHAIAFFRQGDYGRAGLPVLPNVHGLRATRWSILAWTAFLVAASLVPAGRSMVAGWYAPVALALGLGLLGWSLYGIAREAGARWARGFFLLSMPYLVLLLAVLLTARLS